MGTSWRSGPRPAESHGPTLKQLRFIKDLGGDLAHAIMLDSWQAASDYIEELKKRPHPSGTHSTLMVTERQLDYIASLGGNLPRAKVMSRDLASAYIEELKNQKSTTPAAPQPTGTPVTDPRLGLLQGLLDGVKDGYYAVQMDETDPLTFIRVSRPKKGEFADSVKVQTQHSDELKLALVRWPSGKWSKYRGDKIIDLLMILVLDPVKFGLMYAKELNHCMKCNKPLTDERSRHYGIGPDCEKLWPTHIERVDDLMHDGHSYEYLKARSML